MRVVTSKIAFLGVFCNDNPSGSRATVEAAALVSLAGLERSK